MSADTRPDTASEAARRRTFAFIACLHGMDRDGLAPPDGPARPAKPGSKAWADMGPIRFHAVRGRHRLEAQPR